MNDDFEFEGEFDFEDLEQEIEGIDESLMGEAANVTVRTAVLQKNNMVALLCIKSATAGAAICRVDPREAVPAVQLYDDPAAATKWFDRSLVSSKKNGWNIVYDGLPLQG